MKFLILLFIFSSSIFCAAQKKIMTGAERTTLYFPLLKGKRVAVFANQTSTIGNTHLVDSMLKANINVVKIFGPEHGFRGIADAGEHVKDGTDNKSGLPVISLYGDHKKPTANDLKDVDILLFDIQDVGVRYYTFISSLEYYIEAAAENEKPLIILDRPNPNGNYVDGPVLDMAYKSFVGMQPIPIVYGMTVGEYSRMLVEQNWLGNTDVQGLIVKVNNETKTNLVINYLKKNKAELGNVDINIITCLNYNPSTLYKLPIAPSPNLKQMQSIYCYPSTCFFEGTVLSEGRGTDYPFQVFGHPSYSNKLYAFTPKPNAGAKSSKLYGVKCYGWNISGTTQQVLKTINGKIQLRYILEAYKQFPNKDSFFIQPKIDKPENYFFNKLAGNNELMQQIKNGKNEAQIRNSWQPALDNFKAIRKKYLLYN